MPSFKAHLPTEPASVKEVRRRVKTFLHEQGLPQTQVRDAVIAISEACVNAIQYAPTDAGMLVSCDYRDSAVTMKVRDFGRGFSFEGKGQYIEPQSHRGFGIAIMRGLMDEVTYEDDGKGTTVRLVLLIRSASD